ncbi:MULTISPECIES: carbon storage regulator [unclassified Methylophaga]|jgi:sRNA-binding carbon storage regulator CsrA|uniref:carbon storage regulator n=1 Tax=unclassified Methylophaga TaxID=2629249 RepID=UPI00259CE04C|nr:carbon storage regulator [Methylophaga sp. UBA2513]|tara:strand:+ start:41059 stop:41238 length:180 start_codon:yes stop_codon:yes gene_type:complete
MLTLNRKTETSLVIGDDVKITIRQVHVRTQEVTFEVDVPKDIEVALSKMEKTTKMRKVR